MSTLCGLSAVSFIHSYNTDSHDCLLGGHRGEVRCSQRCTESNTTVITQQPSLSPDYLLGTWALWTGRVNDRCQRVKSPGVWTAPKISAKRDSPAENWATGINRQCVGKGMQVAFKHENPLNLALNERTANLPWLRTHFSLVKVGKNSTFFIIVGAGVGNQATSSINGKLSENLKCVWFLTIQLLGVFVQVYFPMCKKYTCPLKHCFYQHKSGSNVKID